MPQANELDKFFKFNVGQMVIPAATLDPFSKIKYQVIERVISQTGSSIEIRYVLRTHDKHDGIKAAMTVHEMELSEFVEEEDK